MKKLSLFLLLFLFIAGCSETEKKEDEPVVDEQTKYEFDTTEIKTTPLNAQDDKVHLKYKFNNEKPFVFRITTISDNKVEIGTADTTFNQDLKQTTVYIMKFNLEDVDVDSVLELSCSISSVKVEGSGMGNSFSYESGLMTDSASREKFSEYAALVNNPFRIRVAQNGEILEVSRVDRIVNEYLKLKNLSDSLSAQEKEMLRRDMSEGALKPLMVILFRNVPDEPVAVDTSWNIAQPQTPFMSYNIQNTYTYKLQSLEKFNNHKVAVIDAGIKTVISGSSKFTDRGIAYTFEKPQTKAEGKIYFNLDLGCVQKSVTESRFTINYEMEASTPQGKQKGRKKEVTVNRNIVELL